MVSSRPPCLIPERARHPDPIRCFFGDIHWPSCWSSGSKNTAVLLVSTPPVLRQAQSCGAVALCPRLILICTCARCKERELVNTPLRGHGLTWADPAQGRGPSGRSSAHRGHHRAPPACLLTRAGPEPLRARPGLTDSRSWKVRDPGLRSVHPPNSRTRRGFCCAWHCLRPPPLLFWTPGHLSLAEGLLETASLLRAR